MPTTANAAHQAPVTDIGGWRLVRTRDPGGGRDAVSIMRTADMTKSGLDLAGLTIRCGGSAPEILVVLVRPLPPRTHPKVILSAAGERAAFAGTLLPSGAAMLLPSEAGGRVTGGWKDAAALSVQIEAIQDDDARISIQGVIPLVGLAQAEPALLANCPPP